jgi:ketosteroid isomerase-like protein
MLSPENVVRQCLDAWAARDVDGTVACWGEPMRYTLHAEEGPLAGTATTLQDLRARLTGFLAVFEFLAYVVESVRADGPAVRTSIVYWYRHKASRLELHGRYRHVWLVEDGRIVSCDEYHDAAALDAFMRLVASPD